MDDRILDFLTEQIFHEIPLSTRSMSDVDQKAMEADFFLEKISNCNADFFDIKCYVSAFISAARSVTFSLQSLLNKLEGFNKWYELKQMDMKNDPLARFFNDFRRINQHTGGNPVMVGRFINGRVYFQFGQSQDLPKIPKEDVETCCRNYFTILIDLLYECYLEFGPYINAHQRYTADFFESIGKKIEDAEEELGFPRGWTDLGDQEEILKRWECLRSQTTGCEINHLFIKYLGKVLPES